MPDNKNKGAQSERNKGIDVDFDEFVNEIYGKWPKSPEKTTKTGKSANHLKDLTEIAEKMAKKAISGRGLGKINVVSTYISRHAFKMPTESYPTEKEEELGPNAAFKKKKARKEKADSLEVYEMDYPDIDVSYLGKTGIVHDYIPDHPTDEDDEIQTGPGINY